VVWCGVVWCGVDFGACVKKLTCNFTLLHYINKLLCFMADKTSYCSGYRKTAQLSAFSATAAKDTLAESKELMLDNSSKDTQFNNCLLLVLKGAENVILVCHWLTQESVLTPQQMRNSTLKM